MALRQEALTRLLWQLNPQVAEVDEWIEPEVARTEDTQRVITHPGVGSLERPDGSILHLFFISLEKGFRELLPTYQNMVRSLHIL
jgi:hypothetical protein